MANINAEHDRSILAQNANPTKINPGAPSGTEQGGISLRRQSSVNHSSTESLEVADQLVWSRLLMSNVLGNLKDFIPTSNIKNIELYPRNWTLTP